MSVQMWENYRARFYEIPSDDRPPEIGLKNKNSQNWQKKFYDFKHEKLKNGEHKRLRETRPDRFLRVWRFEKRQKQEP